MNIESLNGVGFETRLVFFPQKVRNFELKMLAPTTYFSISCHFFKDGLLRPNSFAHVGRSGVHCSVMRLHEDAVAPLHIIAFRGGVSRLVTE